MTYAPKRIDDLQRMQTEPASRAGHEDALPHPDRHAARDGVVDRTDGTGSYRNLGQRDSIGHLCNVVGFHRDKLGVAAHHAGIAKELAFAAQGFVSAPAKPAGTADVKPLRRGNAIATLEPRDIPPHFDDRAGDLVTEDARQLDAGFHRPVADHDVVHADTARLDLDHDVRILRDRVGDGLDIHDLDAAGLADNDCLHCSGPCAAFASAGQPDAMARRANVQLAAPHGPPRRRGSPVAVTIIGGACAARISRWEAPPFSKGEAAGMGTILNTRAWVRKFDLMTLRLFVSVVEERNIGRAAAREAIAASAVTKRIQELEEALGLKVLYRDPRGIVLTPAGKVVERHAREILRSVDHLHRELGEFVEGAQGHVRIWATESVLVEYLADDLGAFSRAFPSVTFDIEEAESVEVLRAVSSGVADVGACARPLEAPERLSGTHYREDGLVAVMTHLHPLAAERELPFAKFLSADLIGWSKTSSVMRLLEKAAAASGNEFKPKYRVTSVEGARSLVRAGLGVAIQPSGMVWPFEDADRIRSVALTDAWAQRKLEIFVARDRPQPIAVQTLVRFLVSPSSQVADGLVERRIE